MYNSARMIGVTIGIIVGLILTIFIIRYVNRNKKLTTEYDEMQKQIRGEGYNMMRCRSRFAARDISMRFMRC